MQVPIAKIDLPRLNRRSGGAPERRVDETVGDWHYSAELIRSRARFTTSP
jgi:hypothetical protein